MLMIIHSQNCFEEFTIGAENHFVSFDLLIILTDKSNIGKIFIIYKISYRITDTGREVISGQVGLSGHHYIV